MKRKLHIASKAETPLYGILRTADGWAAVQDAIDTALYNVRYCLYNDITPNASELKLLEDYGVNID